MTLHDVSKNNVIEQFICMCVWVYNVVSMSQHSGAETKNDVGEGSLIV